MTVYNAVNDLADYMYAEASKMLESTPESLTQAYDETKSALLAYLGAEEVAQGRPMTELEACQGLNKLLATQIDLQTGTLGIAATGALEQKKRAALELRAAKIWAAGGGIVAGLLVGFLVWRNRSGKKRRK